MMQAQSNRAVKTFSIGFREGVYNEAEHAKVVAQPSAYPAILVGAPFGKAPLATPFVERTDVPGMVGAATAISASSLFGGALTRPSAHKLLGLLELPTHPRD
jgi:hypothetical protein